MEEPALSIVKVPLVKNTGFFFSHNTTLLSKQISYMFRPLLAAIIRPIQRIKKKCRAAIMVDLGPHTVLHKIHIYVYVILILIYLLTAVGLTPGGSSTVHIYTQTIHRTTQLTTKWEECGPCSVFACYTLASALQLKKKHEKI